MLWFQKLDVPASQKPRRVISILIDRSFQMKYASLVLIASLIGMGVMALPVFYFVRQNYEIFVRLAYLTAPQLVLQLEREQLWLTGVLILSSSATFTFFAVFSLRLTGRVVAPMKIVRNHLRRMTRGHWSMPAVRIRESDEFQDFVESYNYFYESFRAQILRDLDILKQIKVDPRDTQSVRLWHQMIEERCLQLNLKRELPYSWITADPSAKPSESPYSTRAS
jgi:hypothetical protein